MTIADAEAHERANLETTTHKDHDDDQLWIRPVRNCSSTPRGCASLEVNEREGFHVDARYARRIAERICEAAGLGAVMFESADHPGYEALIDLTLEQREQLPARFHIPRWLDVATPQSWICAVCWDEGTTTSWPCTAAMENGGEVFTSTGEFYDPA
ncbi:hypothetical protein AB0J28_09440 [Streptosporangium canum]|uniref:hypothetical protein n=1 Tax=Streptosporangium canum TaxID=324952 RepID=UPI003433A885